MLPKDTETKVNDLFDRLEVYTIDYWNDPKLLEPMWDELVDAVDFDFVHYAEDDWYNESVLMEEINAILAKENNDLEITKE